MAEAEEVAAAYPEQTAEEVLELGRDSWLEVQRTWTEVPLPEVQQAYHPWMQESEACIYREFRSAVGEQWADQQRTLPLEAGEEPWTLEAADMHHHYLGAHDLTTAVSEPWERRLAIREWARSGLKINSLILAGAWEPGRLPELGWIVRQVVVGAWRSRQADRKATSSQPESCRRSFEQSCFLVVAQS